MNKRKYTLVLHSSVIPGWQVIDFKRVKSTPERLGFYHKRYPVHFVINGWPEVVFPSGQSFYAKSATATV